jgi:hypothetical protein
MSTKNRTVELGLTLLAVAAAGLAPNLGVAAFSGLASMQTLFWAVLVPAELIFLGIFLYARASGMDRLAHRLGIGIVAGVALTIALDVVRYTTFKLGYLPSDMPVVFGKQILGLGMMAPPTTLAVLLGYLYHALNGIAFATAFSVFFGKTRWWVAVLFSVFFVEMGMMLLPPMAKMMGPFGIGKYGTMWNEMFFSTLLAHIAMGVVLGLIEQRWGKYPGLVFTEGRADLEIRTLPPARVRARA